MHKIKRRENPEKRHLHDWRCDGGPWFRANDLYHAARILMAEGFTGPATSHAANGTPSIAGTIEQLASLQVEERDRGAIKVVAYKAHPGDGERRTGAGEGEEA